jgi:hypothetical protein
VFHYLNEYEYFEIIENYLHHSLNYFKYTTGSGSLAGCIILCHMNGKNIDRLPRPSQVMP